MPTDVRLLCSRVVLMAGALFAGACNTMPGVGVEPTATAASPKRADYVEVEVFYATDRARSGRPAPKDFFGSGRGSLEYGTAGVSIPRRHQAGELESPVWWRFEFTEDPAKHVVLLGLQTATADQFHEAIAARTAPVASRNVFVFVHGFNVTFEDAVRRTAQLAYDLKFPGPPVTYSWPSQGSLSPIGYTTDENNVEWTEPHLKQFLVDLKRRVGSDVRIHVLAHSMGNRALTKVMRALAAESDVPVFSQVVLAAPDIDREVFERDIAPVMVRAARGTTLYASSQDRALMFSAEVASYPRAGQSTPPLISVSGLDTIDATGVDTSALGHSYFAVPKVMSDIVQLMRDGMNPDQRKLRPMPPPPESRRYWMFP